MTKCDKENAEMAYVDVAKLSQGLRTAFEGVALVFESLGVDIDMTIPTESKSEEEKKPAKTAAKKKEEKNDDKADDTDNSGSPSAPVDDATEPTKVPDVVEEPKEESSTSTVTIEDITKIIVQKIKQERSNNEKIGQILKTYGAIKVGDLPKDKYEAFLTDLSTL